MVTVHWQESFREFLERKSSIVWSIIPSHEQFNLFSWRVDSKSIQAFSNFMNAYLSDSVSVENVEGVEKIEVWLPCKLDLGWLKFPFKWTLFSKWVYKFIFITDSKNRLPPSFWRWLLSLLLPDFLLPCRWAPSEWWTRSSLRYRKLRYSIHTSPALQILCKLIKN